MRDGKIMPTSKEEKEERRRTKEAERQRAEEGAGAVRKGAGSVRYSSRGTLLWLGSTAGVATFALLGVGAGEGVPPAFRCISSTVKLIARMSSFALFFASLKGRREILV
jgi:hypothetical protein